jgi:transcriptional regulator with XRE-family HTH domain
MEHRIVEREELIEELLADIRANKEYSADEVGYQVARLRVIRGLSQRELAEMVGTHQSSIARLEKGSHSPTLSFLQRVVEALDGKLIVKIQMAEPVEEEPPPC